MTSFFVFFGFVAVLLISLLRILVKKASPGGAKGIDAAALEQEGPRHAIYFPIVQRALCETRSSGASRSEAHSARLQNAPKRGTRYVARRPICKRFGRLRQIDEFGESGCGAIAGSGSNTRIRAHAAGNEVFDAVPASNTGAFLRVAKHAAVERCERVG